MAVYVCCTVLSVPLAIAPSGCSPVLSPHVTVTFWIGAVEDALPAPDGAETGLTVQFTGTPTCGVAFPLPVHEIVIVGGLRAASVNVCDLPDPALAVTVVVRLVVRLTLASPLASVVAVLELRVPKSVEKETGVFAIALPLKSKNDAITTTVPPLTGILVGSVRTPIRSTPAVPTLMLTAPPEELLPDVVPVLAPPEKALT